MSDRTTFQVQAVSWHERGADLQGLRRAVFVIEQQVPEDEEWDHQDAVSQHVLATLDGEAVGTGRLLPDGHIGRMAVLKAWRGRGAGRALLRELIAMARHAGVAEAVLHAQTHAIKFYEKEGFTAEGAEFMEAGIAHRVMRLKL